MSLSLDLVGGSPSGSPWAALAPGFAFDSQVSVPPVRHRPISNVLAAYVLIPLLLVQSLPTLPQEPVRSRSLASWTENVKEGRQVARRVCLLAAAVFVPEIPHPQTPSPFAEGLGRGGSGNGSRLTAELVRTPSSPSAPSGIRPLGHKLGRTTTYDYDLMGRLFKTTYPDTSFEESTYDPEGRRLTSKDRAGRTTSYDYDATGRMTEATFPDATFTENVYDAAGRLTSTTDARGKVTTYEYDTAGRRTKVTDPLSHATEFTYDGNGNQITVKDALSHVTTYEYDNLNRRTKTIFPDSSFTQTTYDEAGRRVSDRDQAGKVTQFRYDKLGRLVKVIDALNQETTYTYDELGNRLTQKDANNHTTSFEYDKLGREVARILPDGARETKTYDALGNLATRSDFLGRVTTYGHDINNRVTSRAAACSSCEKADASWTYTLTGRRATATYLLGGASVTEVYGYDNRDRLASVIASEGASATQRSNLSYTCDANGNRQTLTSTVGGTTTTATYAYDDASRLDTVRDGLGRVYDLGYDAVGNRTSLTHPNGVATTYGYNTLNRLTSLTSVRSLSPVEGTAFIQSYAFTLGPSGNRTQIVEMGKTKVYTYDDLYRLTGEQVIGGTAYTKTFGYDPVGNRQTQTTAGSAGFVVTPGVVNYGYDTRDRLLTENATTYGYDANGNLTTQSGFGTYTFDTENRLVRIAKFDGTLIEHAYDADGVRIRTKTTPAASPTQTTNFLVDTSGGLSHVVAEVNAAGVQTAYYLRALDDLLAVIRPTGRRHYHADGIGSIRKLTDETGAVTDSYEYTAFGEQYEHVGTDPQPYSFAGEPLDPNTGFQYQRARWMQPRTGRFAGMDSWHGTAFQPASLHRYAYVAARPADRVDPTGLYDADTGYAVEDALEPYYKASHPTHITSYGTPTGLGLLPELKPDIVNYTKGTYLEIKPMSLRGISHGVLQMALYAYAYQDHGFRTEDEWKPPKVLTVMVRGRYMRLAMVNIEGLILYSDAVQLVPEIVALTSIAAARAFLRNPRMLASALSEVGTIGRLAGMGVSARSYQTGTQVGTAISLASMGFF